MPESPRTFENGKRVYTSRLQKGGAVLDDMRVLVRGWSGNNAGGKPELHPMHQNVLGKTTLTRAKDVYQRSFMPRFLKGDPPEAWKLIRPLEERDIDSVVLTPIYYWVTARSEPILYDFVVDFVRDRSKSHDSRVRIEEVTGWISSRLKEAHQQWSETVTLKVARGMLAALRDFGVLEGIVKKKVAPIYLPTESFVYLAYVLHNLGSDGFGLVSHPDWRLYLLSPEAVERMFLGAHQDHLLRFDAAGRVCRVEFPAKTLEEMADVIARR